MRLVFDPWTEEPSEFRIFFSGIMNLRSTISGEKDVLDAVHGSHVSYEWYVIIQPLAASTHKVILGPTISFNVVVA